MQLQAVQHWARSSAPEPPLLLVSSSTEALTQAAQLVAGLGACERLDTVPCGQCRQCRLAETETVLVSEDQATITVKMLRDVRRTLARTPLAVRRFVIIPQAQRFSVPAANALLKSLEETAAHTRFLLTSSQPRQLLSTIRSRCIRAIVRGLLPPADATPWDPDPIARVRQAGQTPLSVETLGTLGAALGERLKTDGPSPRLRQAVLRLRDYCRIRAARGNEKLARDVLYLSLP